jgi:negative regulator of flagellin synthesis FlgM
MKVTNEKPVINIDAYLRTAENKKPLTEETKKAEVSNEEKVQLSPKAKEMQRVKEVVEATPDVREEKVAALKEAIDKGTYEVDSNTTAEKMIRESLIDRLL